MCMVAFATQSRIVPCRRIRPLAFNSSASQVLTGDNQSWFWLSLSSCCTRRESRLAPPNSKAKCEYQATVSILQCLNFLNFNDRGH